MAKPGKYTLEKKENYLEFLKEIGVPEGELKKHDVDKSDLDVAVDGKKYTITSKSPPRDDHVLTFTLNEEFEETFDQIGKVKSTAKLDGKKITITSDKGLANRTYDFSDNGVLVTLSDPKSKVVATFSYKKA